MLLSHTMGEQRVGVAISTTGDEHRIGFLETCVEMWDRYLPPFARLFVTVDGAEDDAQRVAEVLNPWTGSVFRVGQPRWSVSPYTYTGRMGVAVNKNTGLELLMTANVEHLFLSDDDTWPLDQRALRAHTELGVAHSMVCWGASRLTETITNDKSYALWEWPRGVVLYQRRAVVEAIGGMDERFGPGGHEHVEWSRRIHQAGLTPHPFMSPPSYAAPWKVGRATGAGALWHCEDMKKPGEALAALGARRRRLTSVRRTERDWITIEKIMAERDGDTSFVSFWPEDNGRTSATLVTSTGDDLSGRGAGGEK